jgi:tRNA-splicing ligase RtcB
MIELVQDGANRWRIPKTGGMRVDGLVYASKELILKAKDDRAVDQVANVAHLPGIVGHSIAMPDIHWGYGFPIGGVAATDVDRGGVVSPGGVGFDIGCGVRLIRSDIPLSENKDRIEDLVNTLAARIPRGVGQSGLRRVVGSDFENLLRDGVRWPLSQGIGWPEDEELTEDEGRLESARPEHVSEKSRERGAGQLGSLGAGNHFLEVQVVDAVFSDAQASAMGLFEGQLCVMIHTGSRGVGHQICTEDLKKVESAMRRRGIEVPDRQLACVPLDDPAGEAYMGSMAAGANFARANRHVLGDAVRNCFEEVFKSSAKKLGMDLVYDVSHNVAKIEEFEIDGQMRRLCVHRKGATRSFGPGHPELPSRYREVGQPVLIPGSMGTASWVLAGTRESSTLSFASTCHGAGRTMSRKAAVKKQRGQDLKTQLEREGILVRAQQMRLLAEEAPYAYKDVDEVVEVCDSVGLSKKVARLRPLAVIKG